MSSIKTYVEMKSRKVFFIITYRGKRFQVSTGVDSDAKFSGIDVPRTVTNWRTKTSTLARLYSSIEAYMMENHSIPSAQMKDNIKSISMDMSSSFNLWAETFLPNAVRIIDRFHVIKALNDRVDKARRRVMAMVDEKTARKIKGNRYVFLKNREQLTPKEERKLRQATKIKECSILAEVHLYKERMRSIYNGAKNYFDASLLLDEWIRDASTSDISELKSAAKTFLRNRDGILAYWSSGGGNNAATEGFNRKTRGLLEMSYGFHEFKFLRLRIFDLGEKNSIKD